MLPGLVSYEASLAMSQPSFFVCFVFSVCLCPNFCSYKDTSCIGGEGNGTPLQYSCLENPMMEEPGRLQSMES